MYTYIYIYAESPSILRLVPLGIPGGSLSLEIFRNPGKSHIQSQNDSDVHDVRTNSLENLRSGNGIASSDLRAKNYDNLRHGSQNASHLRAVRAKQNLEILNLGLNTVRSV